MSTRIVETQDISKGYGGIPVLREISFRIKPGTIVALAGENGAGKSTFLKILSGVEDADSGQIIVEGVARRTLTAKAARELGIALVPQELAPVPDMRVFQNIFLGREISSRGFLNKSSMIRESQKLLDEFGIRISPMATMRDLPVGVQQIVEIIKVLSTGAQTILLDEPTSAISRHESENLFKTLELLKERGVSFVFTTHRMEEIRRVADRVVVLRDGKLTLDRSIDELSDADIIHAMVGRELDTLFPNLSPPSDEVVLRVEGLQVDDAPPLNLEVRRGEILGLAGMVGAGRTELLEAIYGRRVSKSGKVTVDSTVVTPGKIQKAIKAGLGLVPEDRKQHGLVLTRSILSNVSLPWLGGFSTVGVIHEGRRYAAVENVMQRVRLKSAGLNQDVERLSGGNQQKVLLGRWLGQRNLKVLLLDEPTRGVDVGARAELYALIAEAARKGLAVLMVSSDMPEVLGLSHRVIIMNEGQIAGEMDADLIAGADAQNQVYELASGYDRSGQRNQEDSEE